MSVGEELLLRTYRTAEVGKNTMEKLIPMIPDRDLKAIAQIQLDEYNRIFMSSEILLRAEGSTIAGISPVSRMANNILMDVTMIADKSAPRAASIMVEGTDRSIKEMDIALAQFGASSNPESYNLASTLRDCLYRNRRELQRYK